MNIYETEDLKTVGKVGAGSLIHGDCLEVMSAIADQSIDMVLCDLPYG